MVGSFAQFISPYVDSQHIAHWCESLWLKYPFDFKISKDRKSKLGDYRFQRLNNKSLHTITINETLNKHQFLITFLHELAHRVVMEKYGRNVKPHGKEWKSIYAVFLQDSIEKGFYPSLLTDVISKFMLNPKASAGADKELFIALKQFDQHQKGVLLSTLGIGQSFLFRGKPFRKLEVKRTRSVCENIENKKRYYIPDIALVKLI